jgi:hypothetical protein
METRTHVRRARSQRRAERERLTRAEIPHLDCSVHTPASKDVGVKVETHNTIRMSLERTYTLPTPPIPHPNSMVRTPRNQLGLVEL